MVVAIEAHRLAYQPVPKAACTSVKAALLALDPSKGEVQATLVSVDPDRIHGIYQTKRFNRARFFEHEGWFRFTVVRDPLKRLLSVYTDRVVGRRELHNSPNLVNGDSGLPLDPDPDTFFSNLVAYQEQASVVKHHAMREINFVGKKLHLYDKVYRTADLGQLAADLSERTGREVTIPRHNSSRMKLDYSDLAPDTQAILRAELARDYELFEGIFKRPW